MDGRTNTLVSATTTDIATHGGINIGITGLGILFEQGRGRHDLSRLAITTLHYIDLLPGGLHSLTDFIILHGFNRGDFFCLQRH